MNHQRKFGKLRQWAPGHWKKQPDSVSLTAVLLFTALFPATVVHADFDNGLRAFESGYFDKARSEWSKSATAGDAPSQFQLGMLFDKGTGVRENNTQAHFWYALASIGGIEDATTALGEIEKEMTAEEIQQAKDLTDRFVGVFAPIRYITVESDDTGDVITEDAQEEVVQEEVRDIEQPVSSTDEDLAEAPTESAPETDSTIVQPTPDESEPIVSESDATRSENAESASQSDTTQTPSTELSDSEIVNEDEGARTATPSTVAEETPEPQPLAESAPDADAAPDTVIEDSQANLDETVETAVAVEAVDSDTEQNTGDSEVAAGDSSATDESGDDKVEQSSAESPTQVSAVEPVDEGDLTDQQSTAESADISDSRINEADVEPVAKNSPVESRGVLPSNTGNSLDPNSQLRAKMRTLIREVQTMLNDLGYPVGTADGVIGRKTREAVANFQRDNGLPNSGELGPQTIRALRARS